MSRAFRFAVAIAAITWAPPLGAQAAASLPGLGFAHHDWEIVCDNTRTCRAAGYGSEDKARRVSILLTRAAGQRSPITGQLMLGRYGDEDESSYDALPQDIPLRLRINGRVIGTLIVPQDSLQADLPPQHVAALLAAVRGHATIEWSVGAKTWQLSDTGAAAVLLKMDEFQRRVGTLGAIIRTGPRGEAHVLPPLPVPVVVAAAIVAGLPGDADLARSEALRYALRGSLGPDGECTDLTDRSTSAGALTITRLSTRKLLVSAQCWTAAYNEGLGYWVIDAQAPFHPVLVTESGSDFSDGEIFSEQKGRGLGDCWSSSRWTWDGHQFVRTAASTTGMCRLMAPGGAWSLPRIVTALRARNSQ